MRISQSQPARAVTSAWFNDSFVIQDQQPPSAAPPPPLRIQYPRGPKSTDKPVRKKIKYIYCITKKILEKKKERKEKNACMKNIDDITG